VHYSINLVIDIITSHIKSKSIVST